MSQSDSLPQSPVVSAIVPVYNEEGACVQVAQEIAQAFSEAFGAGGFEIIMVDDCSRDATLERLKQALPDVANLRVLHHEKNVGKSGAMRTGIFAARSPLVVTLDGDGQNPAVDAARLAQSLAAAGPEIGMVAGQRRNRQDKASKKWASRMANSIRKSLLKDGSDDTGCGLKALRREVFLRLPYFDQMHRYLPSLVTREGFGILFESVDDRLRTTGQSKYTNIGRLAVALTDLPGVIWLNSRLRQPGRISELG
ncbi:glycosyltransferase family 2 protein [Asticcacaulis sp. EMRT-3]|uniref:glycosyltransferase family 2 protein n=1 Tax=Asticcacaulis sp. EMRT-3 TaxID=3040349 RepID=UPI0024AE8A6D|nr:glycosyltransferase family 2 protein [Asticcacaulis sp. EMRT-3]MDI7773784.1 glycosyltransferase family 2 protein [Asticcacaulis sp. EMRT-3]